MMDKEIILYMPVPHAGYLDLIKRHRPVRVNVLGQIFLRSLDYLSRDARALPPELAASALSGILIEAGLRSDVRVFSGGRELDFSGVQVVMPDEDVSRLFAERYLPDCEVLWDTAFLRWNMQNVTTEFPIDPDEEVSESELDRMFMMSAEDVAKRSPDWWRQVGAVVSKDDICISVFNTHTPSVYSAYIDGDPRTPFQPGERIDVSLSEHAEAGAVSYFARTSLLMEGAKLYVTTFPCPTCARLLVSAGIKEVYYAGGYSLVNAREVFRSARVKVVRVKM